MSKTPRPKTASMFALGLLLLILWNGMRTPARALSTCPTRLPAPPTSGEAVASVAGPTEEQVLDLGHDPSSADIDIPVDVTEGTLPQGDLGFSAGPFRKGKTKIDASAVFVSISRRRPNGVDVNLCIDPSLVGGIAPGTYLGTVRIVDPRLIGRDIAVRVTAQTPHINALGLLGIPGATLIGLLGIWFAERRAAGQLVVGAGAGTAFRNWLMPNGVLIAVAGGVAAFGVWLAQANNNKSFGATGVEFILVLGAMVGAAYGVGGVSSAAAGAPKTSAPPIQPVVD